MSNITTNQSILNIDSSYIEMLVNFAINIIVKDEDESIYYETQESLDHFDKYIKIYYDQDTYPEILKLYSYIEATLIRENVNTLNIHSLKLKIQFDISLDSADRTILLSTLIDVGSYLSLDTFIDLSFKDNYISKFREEFKRNYRDLNKYYLNLQTTYGLDIVHIRNAQNFEVLYVDPNLINSTTIHFQTYYNIVRGVFLSTLFNKAFSKDMIVATESDYMNYYNSYCKFMIVLMTIIEIVQRNLTIPMDVNLLNDFILNKFLYIFGFPNLKHFQLK